MYGSYETRGVRGYQPGDEELDGDDDGLDDYDDENGEDGGKVKGRSRRELPARAVTILKEWLLSDEHFTHPYPTTQDQAELMQMTGIGKKQLKNWFTNARRRIWKPLIKKQLEEAKNQAANGQTPMDSERAAVVASAAQAAGITGIDGAFASGVELAEDNSAGGSNNRARGARSGGVHGRGGGGGRNATVNGSASMGAGDMGGYGIDHVGRSYGEMAYREGTNEVMHSSTSVASFTAGMPRAPSVGQIGGNMKKTDSMAFLESFLQEEVKMAEAKQQNGAIPTHPSALSGHPGVPNNSHHAMHAPPMRESQYPSYNHGNMNAPAGMSIDGDEESSGGAGGGAGGGADGGGGGVDAGDSGAASKKRPLSEVSGSSADARDGQRRVENGSGARSGEKAGETGESGRGADASQQEQSESEMQRMGSRAQQHVPNGVDPQQHPPPYGYGRYYGDDPRAYHHQRPPHHENYPYPPHPMHDPRGMYGGPPMHGFPGGVNGGSGYGPGGVPHPHHPHHMMNPHYPAGGGYYYPQDHGGMMRGLGGPHVDTDPMQRGGGGGQGGYYNPLAGRPAGLDERGNLNPYAYPGAPGGRTGLNSDRPPGGPPPPEKPFTPGMRRATSMELLKRVSSHELVSMGKQQPASGEKDAATPSTGVDGNDDNGAEEARATAVPVSKDEKCAFCVEANVDTQLRPCGHFFHGRCLKPWLQATEGPACCLQCQTPISSCVLAIITPGVPTRNATRGTEEMVPPPPPPLPPPEKEEDVDKEESSGEGGESSASPGGTAASKVDDASSTEGGSEKDSKSSDGGEEEKSSAVNSAESGSQVASTDEASSAIVESSEGGDDKPATAEETTESAVGHHGAVIGGNDDEEEDDEDRMNAPTIDGDET